MTAEPTSRRRVRQPTVFGGFGFVFAVRGGGLCGRR